ncbi:radical SAM protein [Acrocarpospora sp. B8E8]|uniref:radical SAM protein n=1 Tax=Acrocarpospora sp. B8E8 TaxID=3153572 RepID=UPI00325C7C40
MTMLGMPAVTQRTSRLLDGGLLAFTSGHHFALSGENDVSALAAAASAPLSVILQVTKRCDFDCSFCSETMQMKDPSLDQLATTATNLTGVHRVFLSGGEPLLRRDLLDVVDVFEDFIIGLPTNATRGMDLAPKLGGKIEFANIGFDGPREIFRRVRGDYEKVLAGVYAFKDAGIPISFSAVVLRSTLHGLPYLVQIADVLGAGKVKLILPLRKGNALDLPEHEFITVEEATGHFDRLAELRTTHDWSPAVRMTPWTDATEGHMIVIEPNGNANAWPVYDKPDLWLSLGNIREEPISELWKRYPFKENHFAKYLGTSILTRNRAAG